MRIIPILLLFLSLNVFAQNIPEKPDPPRLVNDYVGGLLSDAEISALENKLVAYNDSTSTQIAIVIVKTTEPYDIADFALQLGRKWGVGQEGKDNGIVLLWAPGDRKVTIQTGYGTEGAIPDIYAKRIISNIIAPNFKELRYYQGLDEATTAIINYAKGEYKAESGARQQDDEFPVGMIFLFFLIVIIFIYIASKNKGGGNRGGGRSILSDSSWPYTTYTGWGRQSGHWGGGGFGGGGGSRGGGFGGFGGGSFGGGGASGSY